jgi:hypothetical protein
LNQRAADDDEGRARSCSCDVKDVHHVHCSAAHGAHRICGSKHGDLQLGVSSSLVHPGALDQGGEQLEAVGSQDRGHVLSLQTTNSSESNQGGGHCSKNALGVQAASPSDDCGHSQPAHKHVDAAGVAEQSTTDTASCTATRMTTGLGCSRRQACRRPM